MQETFYIAEILKEISNKLDIIRTLSKGDKDYYNAPYDDDWELLKQILDDKVSLMKKDI